MGTYDRKIPGVFFDAGGASFNVKNPLYGAKGDGTTDDTAAVQAALTAALAVRGRLYFPAGSYRLVGSGTQILLVNKSITIYGDGRRASRLLVDPSVPNTRDVIRVAPPAGGADEDLRGYAFRDFSIEALSGTPARHAIHVDCSTSGQRFSEGVFERLWLGHLNDTGRSMYWNNSNGSGSYRNVDGVYLVKLRDTIMFDGFLGDFIGDTNVFDNVCFFGLFSPNRSVDFSMVPGATTNLFLGCNSATLGGWRVRSGGQVNFAGCIIELAAGGTGSNSAALDLAGDVDQIVTASVDYCQINAYATGTNGLRTGDVVNPVVSKNTFVHLSGQAAIHVSQAGTALREFGNHTILNTGAAGTLFSATSNASRSRVVEAAETQADATSVGWIKVRGIQTGKLQHGYTQVGTSGNVADDVSFVEASAGGGTINLTLPATNAAITNGREITIIKADATGTINIKDSLGTTLVTLSAQFKYVRLIAAISGWYAVGSN